jgi:hypothetical protein
MGKWFQQTVLRRNTIANKYLKQCLTFLAIKEMQIKTTLRGNSIEGDGSSMKARQELPNPPLPCCSQCHHWGLWGPLVCVCSLWARQPPPPTSFLLLSLPAPGSSGRITPHPTDQHAGLHHAGRKLEFPSLPQCTEDSEERTDPMR